MNGSLTSQQRGVVGRPRSAAVLGDASNAARGAHCFGTPIAPLPCAAKSIQQASAMAGHVIGGGTAIARGAAMGCEAGERRIRWAECRIQEAQISHEPGLAGRDGMGVEWCCIVPGVPGPQLVRPPSLPLGPFAP